MKKITLSFDNGPDPDVTPAVLDVLLKHDVRTTFFVVGDKLRDPGRYDLCRRARDEGHWIGNHTFNHLVPLGLSRHKAASAFEIGRTQELIGDLADRRKLFRPFGGGGHINKDLLDEQAYELLQKEGFTCVLWNVVPRDWELPEEWTEVAFRMFDEVEWPLVVLHDITTGAMKHLDEFMARARDKGMEFVQDFPGDCVPMLEGKVLSDMSPFVTASAN